MIEKPTIIITSIGRTGTKFFAILFGDIISESTSLHEPDIFTFRQQTGVTQQLREAGVYNLTIRKILGRWSLVSLSDARLTGKISYADAVQEVLEQRQKFVYSKKGRVYIESNLGYYGLIDVLKDVYRHHRVAYLIRDGRSWVRSFMDRGAKMLAPMYAKGKIIGKVTHNWPTASDFEDDPYQLEWPTMSRFERLCWAWTRLNEYALKTILENPNARLFRFEDIFESVDQYEHLADLVQFTATFPEGEPFTSRSLDGRLDRQVNQSADRFPEWAQWSTEQKQRFQTICGPLMERLNYF
jgi:hypothetical protein